MDERVEDMLFVLGLNDSILEKYKELAELEKKNQQNSKEYNENCELIRLGKNGVRRRIFKYPINDEYMKNFIDTLGEREKTNLEFFDYNTYFKRYRHRRLFEYLEELSLFFHTKPQEEVLHGEIIVDGVSYNLDDDLDELEDEGYDMEQLQSFKDMLKANEKYDRAVDDYSYATSQLEVSVFMKYLLEAIEQEQDTRIKNKLIDFKYNMISTISCLEDSFLRDHLIDNSIEHYHRKLDFIFRRNRSFYPEFIDYHIENIIVEQDKFMDRNKKRYNNVDEKVQDIISSIIIKTHLSCIPDRDIRKNVVEENSAAVELTNSKIDKKVLKRSIQLNKQYTINNQYN